MRSLVCVLKVAASTNKEVEGHIPNYPNLPPQLICQLHDVTMHVRASSFPAPISQMRPCGHPSLVYFDAC
jgi:hypothetical protein